jgi:hypothetical protein
MDEGGRCGVLLKSRGIKTAPGSCPLGDGSNDAMVVQLLIEWLSSSLLTGSLSVVD